MNLSPSRPVRRDAGLQILAMRRFFPGFAPDVHVRSPELDADAPHLHSDGTLCLYHPRRRPWSSSYLVAFTTVPWTAAWLLFYEEWLRLGVWLGPEAPHESGDLK